MRQAADLDGNLVDAKAVRLVQLSVANLVCYLVGCSADQKVECLVVSTVESLAALLVVAKVEHMVGRKAVRLVLLLVLCSVEPKVVCLANHLVDQKVAHLVLLSVAPWVVL